MVGNLLTVSADDVSVVARGRRVVHVLTRRRDGQADGARVEGSGAAVATLGRVELVGAPINFPDLR